MIIWTLALGNQQTTFVLLAIFAPFPVAVYAGYELWQNSTKGYWLSTILQGLQIVIISSSTLSIQIFTGFAIYLIFGDVIQHFQIFFGAASTFSINIDQEYSYFGLNIVSLWAFIYLMRLEPEKFTGTSELQRYQKPSPQYLSTSSEPDSALLSVSPHELTCDVQALTFDCYGTLIDWETGIINAFRPILDAHNVALTDEEILATFSELESPIQQDAYQRYRDILSQVCREFGKRYGFTPDEKESASIAESISTWSPFTDTIESLKTFKSRFKLGILSNIDDDLFTGSNKLLQIEFDWIITAQQVGSYKPSPQNFRHMLDTLGIPKKQILHVAQSLYHDIAPANALGIKTVWVNRRKENTGAGATPASDARPDIEVPSLAELVSICGLT